MQGRLDPYYSSLIRSRRFGGWQPADYRQVLKVLDMDDVANYADGDLEDMVLMALQDLEAEEAMRSILANCSEGHSGPRRARCHRNQFLGFELLVEDSEEEVEESCALEWPQEGIYGTCQKCGIAIAPKRLEAIPHAAFCIKCAQS